MLGRRVTVEPHLYEPGDYGRWEGVWYCRPPGFEYNGNLANHQVVEHDDGTITVSPSILISAGPRSSLTWHGWLERGAWREVA